MRDDSQKWDAPGTIDATELAQGLMVEPVTLTRQTLISGVDILGQTDHPVVAWPDMVTEQVYALTLRRDRMLLVNGPEVAEGWHENTAQAVSDVSDGHAVFDICGPTALATLKRGAEVRLDVPSASVARLLFGLNVFLYRFGEENRFRIHVPRSQTEALLRSLKASVPSW